MSPLCGEARQTTTVSSNHATLCRRADIEEMMKRTGLKLESTASSAESAGPVGKAAKMQEQMFMSAVAECTDFPSFTKRLYPCWVISLTKLATFDELPHHEGGFIYFSRSYRSSTRNTSRFYAAIFTSFKYTTHPDAHASTIIAYRRSPVSSSSS